MSEAERKSDIQTFKSALWGSLKGCIDKDAKLPKDASPERQFFYKNLNQIVLALRRHGIISD